MLMNKYFLHRYKTGPKKFYVVTPDDKIISFGANGYEDFTIHKDPVRKEKYIMRHTVREDWTNLNKAGTWSRFLLWNKPTLKGSIRDMESRFNIKISY